MLFFIQVYGHCLNLFNHSHQQWVTLFLVPQQSSLCHCNTVKHKHGSLWTWGQHPYQVNCSLNEQEISLICLWSCIQASGSGVKSTQVYIHLFIDSLLSSPLFSSAVKDQDRFKNYLYLDHLIQWRAKQHFSLSKVTADIHLTYYWLWILKT